MKTVAFVPIRLNSKRVAGKNLKELNGKPLLCYILETLVKVEKIDKVYVYCSNPDIKKFLPGISVQTYFPYDEKENAEQYEKEHNIPFVAE